MSKIAQKRCQLPPGEVGGTKLRRTGQGAAKTVLFEARAARHHVRQNAGLAGQNLTELNLPVLRANYVCSENRRNSTLMTCHHPFLGSASDGLK